MQVRWPPALANLAAARWFSSSSSSRPTAAALESGGKKGEKKYVILKISKNYNFKFVQMFGSNAGAGADLFGGGAPQGGQGQGGFGGGGVQI